jgi:hypothetical protein
MALFGGIIGLIFGKRRKGAKMGLNTFDPKAEILFV